MDYWSPKHVELLNVMNKINHQVLCILLDYRYKTNPYWCLSLFCNLNFLPNLAEAELSDYTFRLTQLINRFRCHSLICSISNPMLTRCYPSNVTVDVRRIGISKTNCFCWEVSQLRTADSSNWKILSYSFEGQVKVLPCVHTPVITMRDGGDYLFTLAYYPVNEEVIAKVKSI